MYVSVPRFVRSLLMRRPEGSYRYCAVYVRFPLPACARSFTHDYAMYLPAPIAGSVYSRYSAGERPNVPYRKLWQAVDAIAERIEQADGPTYAYLYAPFVDTAEHTYGPSSSQAASVALT